MGEQAKRVQHTPGEWKVAPERLTVEGVKSEWVQADDGEGDPWAVAAVFNAAGYWPESPDYDPAEANARLISAAPDLLAACEGIVDMWVKMGGHGRYSTFELGRIQACIDAIAKAEGAEGPSGKGQATP